MSNDSCIFCLIVNNQATANILYRDQQVTAFRDANPIGPTHLLIVPNKHIESLNELQDEDELLMGYMFAVARKLARVCWSLARHGTQYEAGRVQTQPARVTGADA